MLDRTKDIAISAQAWLDEFERSLGKPDAVALDCLFLADCFWRNVLALSWKLQTIAGRDGVAQALTRSSPRKDLWIVSLRSQSRHGDSVAPRQ